MLFQAKKRQITGPDFIARKELPKAQTRKPDSTQPLIGSSPRKASMFNCTYLACLQNTYPQYILILEHTGGNRSFVSMALCEV